MEIATREEMIAEAVKRMEAMGIMKSIIKDFKKNKTVTESAQMGALYWVEDDNLKSIIKDFEESDGHVVFHCIHSFTNIGELFSMLFVSKYKEEWEYDWENIRRDSHIAMVENLSDHFCSDMGTIGYRKSFGGLVRTW